MKKNLAYILSSAEGGIRKHVIDLIENSIVVSESLKLLILPKNQIDKNFLLEIDGLIKRNVRIEYLEIQKKPTLGDLINYCKVLIFLVWHKIDVAHAHGAKAGLYTRLSKIFYRSIKVIYSPHGGAFHNDNRGSLGRAILFIERLLSVFTNFFVFESNYACELFNKSIKVKRGKQIIIKNLVSIPKKINQIEIQNEILKLKSEGFEVFTVVGRVRKIKGQDFVIESLAKYKKKYKLLLVGPQDEEFKIKLNSISGWGNVIYFGDQADVISFYKYSDLIICPSRAESYGYVPLEALLCDAKVVVSNIPAFLENLYQIPNVYFYECENVKSFLNSIEKCLSCSRIELTDIDVNKIASNDFGVKFDSLYAEMLCD